MGTEITFVYRYSWQGQDRAILVHCLDLSVTCTDHTDGDALGVYTLADDTLVGPGSLSTMRRAAIAGLIRAALDGAAEQ